MKKQIINGICFLIEKLIKDPVTYIAEPDWKKTPLRKFEDKHNSLNMRADLQNLGISPEYAVHLAQEYELKVYKPAIQEHIRINDTNDYKYRQG